MYKIAVFSDIHGNLEALEAILNDINNDTFDEVIYLGDIINIGPNSKECLEKILNSNVKFILGNHDLYYLNGFDKFEIEENKLNHYKWINKTLPTKLREKLKDLPIYYYLTRDNHTFKFNHYFIKNLDDVYPFYGIGTIKRMDKENLLKIIDAEYIFYGHDHEANYSIIDNKHLINVGSSGCVKNNKTYYTILKIDKEVSITKKEVIFNRSKFENKLRNSNYPMLEHYALGFYGISDLHK